MAHFAEINQAPSPYSMLQRIGRVATLKLVPRNCLRYLQTTLIMGRGIGLRIYMRYCRYLSNEKKNKSFPGKRPLFRLLEKQKWIYQTVKFIYHCFSCRHQQYHTNWWIMLIYSSIQQEFFCCAHECRIKIKVEIE